MKNFLFSSVRSLVVELLEAIVVGVEVEVGVFLLVKALSGVVLITELASAVVAVFSRTF